MEQAKFYNDFISYINENMVKVQELLEKVTVMRYETTKTLLETCTLFHPQILIEINDMESNGKKHDVYILEGQEMKDRINDLLHKPHTTAEDYRQIMEEINLINKEIVDLQENESIF